ncbi:mid1-interacting protein 1-B-like [Brienomyrus brachyistius]|uniref:mid1-interacting protein 1-B-like n=1 Tax=Brienomyrus brachyistius TaxID=42636 RepID=UPI0020B2DEB3|nr:mid1-interacting protein 1-B-like [Brienomyrus brachyistius]
MQSAEGKLARSCVLQALRCYSTAVQDMEQTVMLPSLLREVLCEEDPDQAAADGDLYECYLRLKAIQAVVESGLVLVDDHRVKAHQALDRTLEPLLETEPEAVFHFHLKGLLSVMGNLTKKSQAVTAKYLDIVGLTN